MNASARRQRRGPGALDLLEQGVHLLRSAPGDLALYYLGAVPFVLGLLYFCTEMSYSAYAERHHAEAALGVALLFLWMKLWQAVFARGLLARLGRDEPRLPGFRELRRIFIAQATLQPTGLFILPLALLIILPFGWVFAFYQNLSATPEGEESTLTMLRRAHRNAMMEPAQNHALLALIIALGFAVFLNWVSVCYLLPWLIKILFGFESVFTRGGLSVFNTTFFAIVFSLIYLTVDPIVKAVYALRCFHGESWENGEDLRAELKRLRPVAVALILVTGALVLFSSMANVHAAPESNGDSAPVRAEQLQPASVDPEQLDAAIEKVIQQRKYSWRMPREKLPKSEDGVILRFFKSIGRTIGDYIEKFLEWLRRLFEGRSGKAPAGGFGGGSQVLLFVLLGVVLISLVLLVLRTKWRRPAMPDVLAAEAIKPLPDLADENLAVDQLPEDGWMKLGREMLSRGELRLALRAFYLSSLASLADRNLVSLARFKSNRDYQRELERRAHALPGVVSMFGNNVGVFEQVWYGDHPADPLLVDEFLASVQRLKEGKAQ